MAKNTSMKTHLWDSALDPEVAPLFLALQWAHGRSLTAMRPILSNHNLSSAEFDVLACLRNAIPTLELTPSQIQVEMVITSGGLTKILLQLEARGLVVRSQQQDDLRIKPARLSEQGKQAIEVAMKEMMAATGGWMRNALSPEDIAQLTGLLQRLVDAPDANASATEA